MRPAFFHFVNVILLRLGYLPRVWIPPAPLRHAKEVLRYWGLLVRMRAVLKNNLGAMLRKRNLAAPSKTLWSDFQPLPQGTQLCGPHVHLHQFWHNSNQLATTQELIDLKGVAGPFCLSSNELAIWVENAS